MIRRRPLLRAAAVGGAGYLAGKSAANKAQQMNSLEGQVQDLQAAQAATPEATPAPTGYPPGYPPAPAYPPQPGMPGGPPPMYAAPYASPSAYPPQQTMPAESPPPAASAPAPAPAADRLTQLKQLGELHQAGVLTDEEFQNEKQRIMGSG